MNYTEQQDETQPGAEDAGRSTDSVLAHLSLGEVVIPRAFMDDPQFMQMLQQIFQQAGEDIGEFTVGDKANKINPETGYPEFFKLGKLFRTLAPLAISAFGGFPAILGSSTLGSALGGAALGGLTGGGLKGALVGGLTGGLGANIGSAGTGGVGGSGILGAAAKNIPGASGLFDSISGGYDSLSNGISGIGDTLGINGSNNAGSFLNNPVSGGSSLSGGTGTNIGSFMSGNAGAPLTNLSTVGGGITGGAGGTSTFGGGSSPLNFNSLASVVGGVNNQNSLKKQQQQLLNANQQQMDNLGTFDPSNITNDAGYKFNLEQGQQGLNRQLGAAGGLFSGNALKAASEYNQNYANNALNSAYSRWANQTGAQNQLYNNQGNILANNTQGQSNNLNQSLSGALGANIGGYSNGTDQASILKLLRGY